MDVLPLTFLLEAWGEKNKKIQNLWRHLLIHLFKIYRVFVCAEILKSWIWSLRLTISNIFENYAQWAKNRKIHSKRNPLCVRMFNFLHFGTAPSLFKIFYIYKNFDFFLSLSQILAHSELFRCTNWFITFALRVNFLKEIYFTNENCI